MNSQKGSSNIAVSFIIVIIVAAISVWGIGKLKQRPATALPENTIIETKPMEDTNTNTQTATPAPAPARQAKNGDTLVMNYTGRFTNGTTFDSNVDPKFQHVEPFTFVLGAGMVIKGWDEGLVGMKVGEKKTLTISPDKGYGDRQVGSIPANSTLVFDVELVAIK